MAKTDGNDQAFPGEELKKYLHHLPTCQIMQDWSEAEQAMADTPQRFRDESWDQAYEEMRTKMNTCTCGLHAILQPVEQECDHPYASVLGDGEMQPAKCLKCGKILSENIEQKQPIYTTHPPISSTTNFKFQQSESLPEDDNKEKEIKVLNILQDFYRRADYELEQAANDIFNVFKSHSLKAESLPEGELKPEDLLQYKMHDDYCPVRGAKLYVFTIDQINELLKSHSPQYQLPSDEEVINVVKKHFKLRDDNKMLFLKYDR